jgi:hypothetical protein
MTDRIVTPGRKGGIGRMAVAAALTAVVVAAGCSREPTTPEAKRERGDEIVRGMSEHLARASTFRVQTTDARERTRGGQPVTIHTTRHISVRRPDRIAMTVTGDIELKAWYDGQKLTFVSDRDKVWARVKAEPTIDATLDRLAERLALPVPAADFLYSSPYEALIGPDSTGGYVGRETVNGVECFRVAYKNPAAEWDLWVPAAGDPLPRRFRFVDLTLTPHKTVEIVFDRWELGAVTPDSVFAPAVPAGFERIPLAVQAESTPGEPTSPAVP